MSRRHAAVRRQILPDAKFGDELVAKLMNYIMKDGKKSAAEKIVYSALAKIEDKKKSDPLECLKEAIEKIRPTVEVKSRRVGGATYQVPIEVPSRRAQQLALRWLIESSKKRGEKTMDAKLAGEILDALEDRGSSVKKREDTHKMAEANKAFSHYRW
jgi:small subunit ribosomal protein S7